jgi:small GTP-binding protein
MGIGVSNEVTVLANLRALPVTFIKRGVEKSIKLQLIDTAG